MKLAEAIHMGKLGATYQSESRNRKLKFDALGVPIDINQCCVASIDVQDWLASDWRVKDETG